MSPVTKYPATGIKGADDRYLVDLARTGSSEAFCQLDARYRFKLRRYCRGLVGEAAADDVVQQTLANAFSAMKDADDELDLKPWLFRIAHNAAVDNLRRAPPDHEQIPDNFDGVMQPQQKVAQTERLRELVQNIAGLPCRQRTALVMSELEGRSHVEVAQRLQTGQRTVKDLIYHARNSLRGKLSAILPFSWLARQAQLIGTAVPGGGGEMAASIKVVAVVVLAAGGISAAVEFGNADRGAAEKANVRAGLVDQSGVFDLTGGALSAMLPPRPGKTESFAVHNRAADRAHSDGDTSAGPSVEDGEERSARPVVSVPMNDAVDGRRDSGARDKNGLDDSNIKSGHTGKSAAVGGGGSLDGGSPGGGDEGGGSGGSGGTDHPVPGNDDENDDDVDDGDDDEDDEDDEDDDDDDDDEDDDD